MRAGEDKQNSCAFQLSMGRSGMTFHEYMRRVKKPDFIVKRRPPGYSSFQEKQSLTDSVLVFSPNQFEKGGTRAKFRDAPAQIWGLSIQRRCFFEETELGDARGSVAQETKRGGSFR